MILESYGFVEAGEWHPSERHKGKIVATLTKLADKRVVYAFVVDDEVKYVVLCDSPNTTLKDRMDSQRSNKEMPRLIKQALDRQRVVKIFALNPNQVEYKGLRVDMVRGLEYPVIDRLGIPEWNTRLSNYRRQKGKTRGDAGAKKSTVPDTA